MVIATLSIGLLFGAGLAYGEHAHISIMEYWRWWVVHLWVEGFFEVFATTVIAFFFTRLGLVEPRFAAQAALLTYGWVNRKVLRRRAKRFAGKQIRHARLAEEALGLFDDPRWDEVGA